MASDRAFVEFILDQLSGGSPVTSKRMFGEYALYQELKVVALICDNALYVKQTAAGRSFIGQPIEAPPYKGAKPYFFIQDAVEDREWLQTLFAITSAELPEPPPKRRSPPREKRRPAKRTDQSG